MIAERFGGACRVPAPKALTIIIVGRDWGPPSRPGNERLLLPPHRDGVVLGVLFCFVRRK